MEVKIQLDPTQKILMKRHLEKNGQAQELFTRQCYKYMNPYVPFKTGTLKDIKVKVNTNNIIFYAPYAEKQYYTNQGNGREGTSKGGLRGKYWDKRMWNSWGNKIVKNIADYVGGEAK